MNNNDILLQSHDRYGSGRSLREGYFRHDNDHAHGSRGEREPVEAEGEAAGGDDARVSESEATGRGEARGSEGEAAGRGDARGSEGEAAGRGDARGRDGEAAGRGGMRGRKGDMHGRGGMHGRGHGDRGAALDAVGGPRGPHGREGRGHHRHGGGREGHHAAAQTFRRGRALGFLEELRVKRDILRAQLNDPALGAVKEVVSGELKAVDDILQQFIHAFELQETND